MPRRRPKPKFTKRPLVKKKTITKRPVPIHQHTLVKRLRHAETVLRQMGLSRDSLLHCTRALAELDGQKVQLDIAKKIMNSFPHAVKTSKIGSPLLRSNFEKAEQRVKQEEHYVNIRLWKLIIDFDVIHPGKGEMLTRRAISEYEHSFRPKI